MSTPFYKLYSFYVALAGVIYLIVRQYYPGLNLSIDQIAVGLVVLVGLFGIKVEQGFRQTYARLMAALPKVPTSPPGSASGMDRYADRNREYFERNREYMERNRDRNVK